MKLYVMRHAPAGPKSQDSKRERERPLTEEGVKVANAIADAMADADEIPSVIFCSPFTRTTQTADIVGTRLGISVNVVGDLSPDRPLEDVLLGFMAHYELKRFLVCGHTDNTVPAFNKFGGDMSDCLSKDDKDEVDGDKLFWPQLAKGEVRRLSIHREFGYWQCRWRLRPSDLSFRDDK